MNLRQGVADAARPAARARRVVGADRRRADAVARGAGGLDQGPRVRHRRRQPDVSHRHPRAIARSAGGRRPARRQRHRPGRAAGRHRRRRQRAHRRSGRRDAARGPRGSADDRPPGGRRRQPSGARPAATADGVRIRLDANIEFPDDLRGRALRRRRRHRPVSLGVPARRRRGRQPSEDEQYEIYRGMLEGMAPGPVTVRTFDVDEDQLASRLADAAAGRRVDGRRGARQPPGPARPAPEPDAPGAVPARSCARCCARARHGTLRIMFPFVSSVEQLREARRMVAEAAAELARRGEPVPHGAGRRR